MSSLSLETLLLHKQRPTDDLEQLAKETVLKKQQMIQENAQLRAALDAVPDPMAITDITGKMVLWNAAAKKYAHMSDIEAPVDQWDSEFQMFFLDGTPVPIDRIPLMRSLETCRPVEGEFLVDSDFQNKQRIYVWARPILVGTVLCGGALLWRVLDNDAVR